MNIVVNTQLLLYGRLDGIGWFTWETISRITAAHPEHTFYLVFDRKPAPELQFSPNVKTVILSPMSRHPFLWFLRFEILLPVLLKRLKADLFLSPDGWMTTSSKVPCVQVIHDLNFVHFPKDIPFWTRNYYNFFFPRYARKAKRIATVSQYSKEDIVKTFGVTPEKVVVMHNGCNTSYKPLGEQTDKQTRTEFSEGNPYFIYVGALIPRKNIARMFEAFDLFKKNDTQNTKFVIVGQKKWWTDQINASYEKMQFKEDVLFLGRRNVQDLNRLYSAAIALVFPAIFEGFGIPILEAFHAETAVITSNVSSMPEVAGDAAILVDPASVDSIASAMTRLSKDENLVKELIEKGRKRRSVFSWDHTAAKLWQTIEDTLAETYTEQKRE
ncbi:MAG: glycosyltransferase family 4 protein [Bacteroidota bacterium]